MSVFHKLFIIDFSNILIIRGRGRDGAETRLADTVGALVCLAPVSTRCRRARHAAWGGSPVGGHSDVFSGGSLWTVTGPLFDLLDLLVFSCSPVMVMLDLKVFIHIALSD